ncbi:hypothetical protein HY633_04110 [Candidatus Uhrbacteria bacterium]|nr:hypothetical protein [Candidatus Uhrbacteria bacterium]
MCTPLYSIYALPFPNSAFMAATVGRMHVYGDRPSFSGSFDFEDLLDWDIRKHGKVEMFDWVGFMLSSEDLKPFFRGDMDPLGRKEAAVVRALRKLPEPYWVIFCAKGDNETLRHEFVHCVFGAFPEYKKEVVAFLKTLRLKRARKRLRAMGYVRGLHFDELNAYVLTGLVDDLRGLGLARARRTLERIFRKHFGFMPKGAAGLARIKRCVRTIRVRMPRRETRKRRK